MFCWAVHLRGPETANQTAVTVRHCVYCFGGYPRRKEKKIDVHVFNTVSLIWRKLTPVTPGRGERHLEVPSRCYGHTAALIEDIVYLWGGREYNRGKFCNMLYAFDVDAHTWFKPHVSGTVPKGRYYHSACVLGEAMFIHGGWTQLTGRTNDIYKLDTKTMVWALINTRGTAPPATGWHSVTIIGTKMFVFGGSIMHVKPKNSIRVFDTETNLWVNTPSAQLVPEGRCRHSAFSYNGELYIFGGEKVYDKYSQTFNDLWKFNPESFSWKKVEPKGKGPSLTCTMCCCMVGDLVILFGERNTPDDLYVLDLSPSLKTLCKLAVIQYGLEQTGLPHNTRWELAAMTSNSS